MRMGRGGGGGRKNLKSEIEICHVFGGCVISKHKTIDLLFIFKYGGCGGVKKLVIFCGRNK